jgi:hypothetical protein
MTPARKAKAAPRPIDAASSERAAQKSQPDLALIFTPIGLRRINPLSGIMNPSDKNPRSLGGSVPHLPRKQSVQKAHKYAANAAYISTNCGCKRSIINRLGGNCAHPPPVFRPCPETDERKSGRPTPRFIESAPLPYLQIELAIGCLRTHPSR